MKRITLSLLAIPVALCAQTTINGGRIIKGTWDASGSVRSLPSRTGAGSPAGRDTCLNPGEMYFQADATPGQNLWACTASGSPGTWNQITGSGSGGSVTTGTTAPGSTCSAGSLYMRTDVQQFYVCAATNVWQLASYGSGLAASRPANCVAGQMFLSTDTGTLSYCSTPGNPGAWQVISSLTAVSLNGVSQGSYSTLNLVNPTGLNWTLTPNGQTLGIAPTPDTTYLLSQAVAQNGSPFSCAPASNNSSTYTCNLVPAPSALTNGMLVEFRPDVSCAGGATTLNINGLGAKPIYSLDGTSNPMANDCRASRPTWLIYSTALNAFIMQSVANLPAQGPASTTLTFSATPVFAVTSTIQEFTLTLTTNVTSSTLSGAAANDILVFNICQNATGNWTFAWPTSGFSAAPAISSTASSCTRQMFVWDGSNANPVAPATVTNVTPFLISQAPERPQPSTPATGLASLWPDSTRHTWTSIENNSGNVHIMPRAAGAADQLASTDLSDSSSLMRNNPMTTSGDMLVGGTAGALTRLAAPANGTWCPNWSSGTVTWITCPGAGGSGLTSVGLTMPSWLTVTGSPLTSNGTLGVTANTQTANTVLAGPSTGSAAAPGFRSLVAADLTANTTIAGVTVSGTPSNGQVLTATSSTAANWQAPSGGGAVSSVFGRTGAVAAQSGDYTAAQVTNAAATNASNTFTAGTQNFSGAAHTLPAVTGIASTKPGTCTVGEMYFATDATAGQNWYYCTATNTWTQQLNSGSSGGGNTAPFIDAGDYGTTTTTQTTLSSITIPANTLASGKAMHIVAAGADAATGNTILLSFGGTTIITEGIGATNWIFDCWVYATGASAEKSICAQTDSGNNAHAYYSAPAISTSGNITVSVLATAGSTTNNAVASHLLMANTVNY